MRIWSLFLLVLFLPGTFQNCIWYGECNNENGKIQNCLAKPNQHPLPLKSNISIEILKQKCSFLLQEFPEENFCCDDAQVRTMQANMDKAAGIFSRCPTCIANLNKHICLLTCSPKQNEFMEVMETKKNASNVEYITGLNIYLSKEYTENTFDSCKEVTTPSTGGKAIDVSCGIWGAANLCTAERWFEFFGDYKGNILAPFSIYYITTPSSSFKNLDIKVLPCNESYVNSRACSCSDCEASCTIPFEHPTPPDPFVFGGIDGVLLIVSVLFAILSTMTLVLLLRYHYASPPELPEKTPREKKSNCFSEFGMKIKSAMSRMFTKWGIVCARNPVLVFAISSWVIAGLGYGVSYLRITTNPTEIWASPVCESRLDKTYFDSRFTPFYRTNQVFIKSKGLKGFTWTSENFKCQFGPAFNINFLKEVYNLQMDIQKLGVETGQSLEKICFAPMKNEFFNEDSVEKCTIQSVWGYLQNDVTMLDDPDRIYNRLQKCLRNNFDPECLAPYGGPIFSPLAVGNPQQVEETDAINNSHLLASGVTLTFVVNNARKEEDLEVALAWEKMFIDFLKDWNQNKRPEFIEIAFSAERSIQDEIERESKAEMTTIIISYFVMFVYITISLGRIRGFSSLLLDSKFSLGVGGIVIVLASVVASAGVFGYLEVPTTLLTIEVIPFLVLAVGVDNIFILVHTYQELQGKCGKSIEEDVGTALGKVGPSILLTSTSEATCFFIGTFSDMPAIKTFAEYSSLAITLNFLLQITCFVSLLALDSRRQTDNRVDIICCIKIKKGEEHGKNSNTLQLVFKSYYGPFLMKPWVRISVIMIFITWLSASIACIPHIEKGLDQELSMPEDSHVIDYFQFMKDLLSVGPPVYFVIKGGLNFTNPVEVNAVCGSVGCDSDSLVTYLTRASRLSNISYIAQTPSSWIDDYFDWLSNSKCCRQFQENSSFCPHQYMYCEECKVTMVDWRPQEEDFKKYLPYFLNDNPDVECPKAGHPAYAGGVNFEANSLGQLEIKDNYFMTYHTSLKTSRDFYMALENARGIAKHLSKVLTNKLKRTIEVFPYSVFYVYYEQYLTIVEDALISLSLSLLAVLSVTFLLTGFDFKSSGLVGLVVASLVTNMTGMLYWWNITLNAVSLVNLLVAVGIGVEFCSHIMHAFVSSTETDKVSKALFAIGSMGSSVFSGITLTKFLGIVVLAFAQTLMLRTFYFKMYLGIVVMGAAHGLVLMPVLLSYLG